MTKNITYVCKYCDRALKSKAGLVRHESSCKAKDVDFEQLEEDIAVIDNTPTEKVVELDIVDTMPTGKDNNYYEGHPRRLIKLKGLLSRTMNSDERKKIIQMIVELRDEHK